MAVPARVRRGASSSDYYYWDGVNPMTVLGGGIGDILNNSSGFNVPLVTLSATDFDAFQNYLEGRRLAFDTLTGNALAGNDDYLQAVADAVNSP